MKFRRLRNTSPITWLCLFVGSLLMYEEVWSGGILAGVAAAFILIDMATA